MCSVELLKDYDCVTEYHQGKVKVVVDALICKSMGELRALFARLSLDKDGALVAELRVKSTWSQCRLCLSRDEGLRRDILLEAHSGPFAKHPGSTKIFRDLRALFLLLGLKHVLEDMLQACVIDLFGSWESYLSLVEFVYNNSFHASIQMALFEVLYGRKCHTPLCWTELSEKHVVGPELIQETDDKVKLIKDQLKVAFDRKKSYTDLKHREVEYAVGDLVFLKDVLRLLESVRSVVYYLRFSSELECIHNMFHVSMLRKYRLDHSHVLSVDEVEVLEDLSYEEEHVKILARDLKVLWNKVVPLIKVFWRNHNTEEATWEMEESMRS
ncbi:uncharacterized protein LOC120210912 [Hibiscus syriacus]|uniref:uncharacterized protein LOC120210912 n=1 Tax=Hibiscus syriacus TaxID=106335 RepID=UPI001923EA2F|nr:uncharacterized protein LOC120210912 [Hibiscus syriacus]